MKGIEPSHSSSATAAHCHTSSRTPLTRPPATSTAAIDGSTVTDPVRARPATTWRGVIGVTRSCRSHPIVLSSATPPPVLRAEPTAPYAAMPTMEIVFHSGSFSPRLVNSTYIITGIPTPKITNMVSRRVLRTSSLR